MANSHGTVDPNGLPDQQVDAAGTVRINAPCMVLFRAAQSLVEGHELSLGVVLQTGDAVWRMTLALAKAGANRREVRMA